MRTIWAIFMLPTPIIDRYCVLRSEPILGGKSGPEKCPLPRQTLKLVIGREKTAG
jgi:hypothetical protein